MSRVVIGPDENGRRVNQYFIAIEGLIAKSSSRFKSGDGGRGHIPLIV